MKLYESLNDCTVTVYRVGTYKKTGIIKFETKNLPRRVFVGYKFGIKEPQNNRFYENCFDGLQVS